MTGAALQREGPNPGPDIREYAMNPLGPVLIVLLLPISAIGILLYTDTGIEPALITATVKTFVALFAIAGILSYGASRLAARSEG